jgi:hypothetical protein
MNAHKNYLLKLTPAPTIIPANGSIATIFDWQGGDSFTVVCVVVTHTDWGPLHQSEGFAHVLATKTNGYSAANLAGSRLRYRDNDDNQESREIIGITALD